MTLAHMPIEIQLEIQLEIRPTLDALLTGAQRILGAEFIGLYLGGSLATGDFNLDSSDIDFVAVTAGEIAIEALTALQRLHQQLAEDFAWGKKLEGDYAPLGAFRRYDIAHSEYPHVSTGGHCAVEGHGSNEVIQLWTIREHGIVLAGPDPKALIDPVQADDLRQAVRGILNEWWRPMLENPVQLASREYQAYATLTMCRMRYTLATGAIPSKPAAAKWAQHNLDARWRGLIARAQAWPNDGLTDEADLAETLAFVRETVNGKKSDVFRDV